MSASTRRILLLGVAVIFIASTSPSNVAYAQSEVQQQMLSSDPTGASAAHAAIRIGHGKTERTEDGVDGEVVSAAVAIDRQPLIAVPVLVQVGAHGQEVESASSGSRVRFELDHQVPPIEVLKQEAAKTGNVRRADPVAAAGVDQQSQEASNGAVAEGAVTSEEKSDAATSEKMDVATTSEKKADTAISEKAGDTVVVVNDSEGTENPVVAPPSQDEAAPILNPEATLQDSVPSDKVTSDSEPKPEAIPVAITFEATPSGEDAQAHGDSESKSEEEAQTVSQQPVAQSPPEIVAEPPKVPEGAQVFDKAVQPPSAPVIDLNLLDTDPAIHAILDASAEAFGSPQIPPITYISAIDPTEGSEAGRENVGESEEKKKEDQEAAQAESEVIDGVAKVLFEQYRAKIEAELESYKSKVSPNDGQAVLEVETSEVTIAPPKVDVDPSRPSSEIDEDKEEAKKEQEKEEGERVDIGASTGKTSVKLNKLNKNHDGYDLSEENASGDDLQPQVLMHQHHHHVSNGSPKQQQKQEQQEQQQHEQEQEFSNNNVIVANDDRPLAFSNPVQETTPAIHQQLNQVTEDDGEDVDEDDLDEAEEVSVAPPPPPAFPPTAVPPEELRTRGLVPSVKGAYHCTPQFCVNVSLTDDGQFATFHIERAMDETGWISLGIGYAMTTADLLIMWPNNDPASGGGPRGATLSRRTSHAYVEPQQVSREEAEIKASGKGESLYPEGEYILHNPSKDRGGEVAMAAATQVFPVDGNRFIVQFTRPVRTQNRVHKLTPGKEQDFCWAYSPKPVSADSVGDPGAHITQHLSVGSFAMDVGANQPQLKEAIKKQQEIDAQEAVIEKARKKWALDESNRRLEEDEKERLRDEKGTHKVSAKHKSGGGSKAETSDASTPWLRLVGYGEGSSSSSMLALQGFSCLVAMAFMWFFR
ncbi:hypothetical protein EC991_007135 [Linnemannia zychae]|nr:hypothetical protein EC991_007135 [Linnemannia zychae]